jgi:hypothetical protein
MEEDEFRLNVMRPFITEEEREYNKEKLHISNLR